MNIKDENEMKLVRDIKIMIEKGIGLLFPVSPSFTKPRKSWFRVNEPIPCYLKSPVISTKERELI